MSVLNETIYILPTKSTATNESLRPSEFTGLKRIKNLRQRNHESGTYLMVSRILFKVLQVLFKTSSKCFLPDKIIVIAALFVKHDNAFYHIWGSRVSVFSVIEIIFATSILSLISKHPSSRPWKTPYPGPREYDFITHSASYLLRILHLASILTRISHPTSRQIAMLDLWLVFSRLNEFSNGFM